MKTFLLFIFCFVLQTVPAQISIEEYNEWSKVFDLGDKYFNSREYDNALLNYKKAYSLISSYQSKNLSNLVDLELSTLKLAWTYEKLGDFSKATEMYEKDIILVEKTAPVDSDRLAYRLTNYATLLQNSGQQKPAIELLKRALKHLNNLKNQGMLKVETNKDPILGIVLNNLGVSFYELFLYDEARLYLTESLKVKKKYLGVNHTSYKNTNSTLRLAQGKNAIDAFIGSSIGDFNTKDKKPSTINELISFGKHYLEIEDYEKAEDNYNKALELSKKENGEAHFETGTILNNMSVLFNKMGEHEKSIEYSKNAIDNLIQSFGKKSSNYPVWVNNLASIYVDNLNYEQAEIYFAEAYKYAKLNLDKSNLYYNRILNNIALFKQKTGNLVEAENLLEIAIKNLKKHFGEDHPDYGNLLNNLAGLISDKNNLDKAEKTYLKALEIQAKKFGRKNRQYGQYLVNLSTVYLKKKKFKSVLENMKESNKIQLDEIEHMLRFRSEKENKAYLITTKDLFQMHQSFDIITNQNYPSSIELNLNSLLTIKGMLLNNSLNVIDGLKKIKKPTYVELIENYKINRKRLIEQEQKNNVNAEFEILKNTVNNLEEQLVKNYNKEFPEKDSFFKNWIDVKNTMNSDEIAVEFSSFRYRNINKWTDSIFYVAYIIKKEWNNPKMIPLFNEKELIEVIKDKSPIKLFGRGGVSVNTIKKDSEKLYELIWKPLEDFLEDSKTIYYSPDGLLHQYPLGILSEKIKKKETIRLTSIYNISKGIFEPSKENPLLIGGINYDSAKEEPLKIEKKWEFLPGSLAEVIKIQSFFREKNINAVIIEGVEVSEKKINSINGNSPKVLHLATHGYFFNNQVRNSNSNKRSVPVFANSENPLLRSGLLLSGGNLGWSNPDIDRNNDGILSALEISNMDLSNTDLVVLSACETGLGDIDSDEGVYGLQRAFKLAGVKLIMMSLWQVPDKETSEFMGIFYSNWLNGLSVREAFKNTQLEMSRTYPDETYKWAGFILSQ